MTVGCDRKQRYERSLEPPRSLVSEAAPRRRVCKRLADGADLHCDFECLMWCMIVSARRPYHRQIHRIAGLEPRHRIFQIALVAHALIVDRDNKIATLA